MDQLCRERFGTQPIKSTAYIHRSGWKYSGAYRVILTLADGRTQTLIYKNAIYVPNHIPAVIGLPVHPGPPKYTIYSQGDTGL